MTISIRLAMLACVALAGCAAPGMPPLQPPPEASTPPAAGAQAPKPAPAAKKPAAVAQAPATTPAAPAAPREAAKPATPRASAPAKPAPAAPPSVAAAKPAPSAEAAKPAPAPAMDLKTLEQRLKETNAIGVMTKLSLKNQVDDLIDQFRDYYAGRRQATIAELRRPFDLLLMKVLALLQDADPALARAIHDSREAIWAILADRDRFQKLT